MKTEKNFLALHVQSTKRLKCFSTCCYRVQALLEIKVGLEFGCKVCTRSCQAEGLLLTAVLDVLEETVILLDEESKGVESEKTVFYLYEFFLYFRSLEAYSLPFLVL